MAKRKRRKRPDKNKRPQVSPSPPNKAVGNSVGGYSRAETIAERLSEANVDLSSYALTNPPPGFITVRHMKKRILEAMAAGANNRLAASYAGISASTLGGWLRRGREELLRLAEVESEGIEVTWDAVDPNELPYVEFVLAVDRVRGAAGMKWLDVLNNAAMQDPKWAAYNLENSFGWKSQTVEQHVTGHTNVSITVEQLAAARDAVREWESERFDEDGDDSE